MSKYQIIQFDNYAKTHIPLSLFPPQRLIRNISLDFYSPKASAEEKAYSFLTGFQSKRGFSFSRLPPFRATVFFFSIEFPYRLFAG